MKSSSKKLKVALLFGGKSVEHEVSLKSARNIAAAMDKNKYDISYVCIDKKGNWLPFNSNLVSTSTSTNVSLVPVNNVRTANQGSAAAVTGVDVVFPVLHGSYGEDGTIQGLLKLAGIPFVGCGVLGSAVAFDKDVTKRLLRDAGIANAKFITVYTNDTVTFEQAKKQLGLPLFVKPANSGSSVGVSKVLNKKEFSVAIADAFRFDSKVLIEEFIDGRELECAILGNENPIASVVGEVVTTNHRFYSYEAKYLDENGARIEIPAKLSKSLQTKIQKIAIKTFQTLGCEGLSRVDVFLKKNGEVYVNEVNTLPGFTNISMYPSLWKATGISYSALIDRLIELALERHTNEQKLQTSYTTK